MPTSASQNLSCMSTKRSVGTDEWILSKPVIDNPIYDFFEEAVPPLVPFFDTEDHTYAYLIHASYLTRVPIKNFRLPEPTADKRESPTKHGQDVAAPPPAASTLPEKLGHDVATEHVITVETEEDVVEEILGLAKSGSKSVYIHCASGKLSTVALYKSSTPSETITRHKGVFDIVSLSGWYMRDEIEGMRCWTGGLHLSSTADGIAFEGYVAGKLIAASPVQVCSSLSHVLHLFLHTLTGGFCQEGGHHRPLVNNVAVFIFN